MTDCHGRERRKRCPVCNQEFDCCPGACWCDAILLPRETLTRLRQSHPDCLCPNCLRDAARDTSPQSPQEPTP